MTTLISTDETKVLALMCYLIEVTFNPPDRRTEDTQASVSIILHSAVSAASVLTHKVMHWI